MGRDSFVLKFCYKRKEINRGAVESKVFFFFFPNGKIKICLYINEDYPIDGG